ncbi:ribonuclease J [Hirschia litorea]|uniref:Ribonuclease J n=1 Tax=Hirschia litorea TaxID=1199156 RepID=A0ABW2IHY7_9PROT
MTKDELLFLPVGGCREIGMNLNAYAYGSGANRRWLIVDVGVTFGGPDTPGIDLIMPDTAFLETIRDQIDGIVLTHAHEDHIGALAHLWPRLRAPLYATPFTAYLINEKLKEKQLDKEVPLNIVELGDKRTIGPFDIEYVTLTHSIPEPNGVVIRTPAGVVFHTGDWKIDPNPMLGKGFDEKRIKELGDEGILAIVCDSTNVFEDGESGSEETVRENLIKVVAEQKGKVAITTFASNVARLESCCIAAVENERSVCLVGRSMFRITDAAKEVGLLKDIHFVDAEEAQHLAPENILYLCTGSQGEPRAALSKIANGSHPQVKMGEGDTVLFSSRVIPGNERGIFDLQNSLAENGVKIITDRQEHIHVSGHPCRDELRRMYQWAKPQISVPVHGERRHILEHARYALSMQVPEAISPNNGDVIRLFPGPVQVVDEVPTGRLFLDGNRLTPEHSGGMQERRRMSWSGHLSVSVAIDDRGRLKDGPFVSARGFSETDGRVADESLDQLDEAAEEAMERLAAKDMEDDDKVERALLRSVRKSAEGLFGKRPLVDIAILRV